MTANINLLVVFGSAVVNMIIGMAWYSPMFFGKSWMSLMGMNEKKTNAMKKSGSTNMSYGLSFISSLLVAFMLAYVLYYTGSSTLLAGVKIGFLMWLGFVVTTSGANVLFEGKRVELYSIDMGYHLVSFVVMASILAIWG